MPWFDPDDLDPETRALVSEVTGGLGAEADVIEHDEALRPGPPGEAPVPSSQPPPDLRKARARDT
jgi:hypothetical protein